MSGSAKPGSLAQQPRLVVVDREVLGTIDHFDQLVAGKQRQALTGIENERNARSRHLLHVRAHSLAPVGRDDAERDVADIADAIGVGVIHRAGMKRRDLIVVEIGDDERLRRVRACDRPQPVGGDAERRKSLRIGAIVAADRRHHHRFAAERLQVVGDVAGASAPLAAHFADQKRHRQHVRLFGQDVTREPVRKDHDRIERERTADERAWCHETVKE